MFKSKVEELISSKLYDQDSFYPAFLDDLKHAKHRVIIESPFITARRMHTLLPIFTRLRKRGVQIIINTKPLDEHEPSYYVQAAEAIENLQAFGILVLFTTGHHRKISIIDNRITWEGSLNILSQNDSCEIMRRINSEEVALQTLRFMGIDAFLMS